MREWVDIEPDQFKQFHPRYSDDMADETDDEVHRWSVRRSVDAFDDAVESPQRPDVVLDSSGSNVSWLRHRLSLARERGYEIKLLWVDVPLEIALLRNRDRAAMCGNRTMVPDKVLEDKAELLPMSFEEVRKLADSSERFQNWSARSGEQKRAEDDLYLYPPPRTRPPDLRPGDEGYGEAPSGARSPSPTPGSRRTVRIGPWKRNDQVMREKNARLDWMDGAFKGNRERFVLENVLCGRDVLLEPNRFPYQLPPGITHWTIWSRKSYSHEELCEYINGWLNARKPHNVIGWNYDDNRGNRTIDIWHVHIYFQGSDGQLPQFSSSTRPSNTAARNRILPSASASCHRSPCSV
jgi:hypothetical protein